MSANTGKVYRSLAGHADGWVSAPKWVIKRRRANGVQGRYKTEQAARAVVAVLNLYMPEDDVAWMGEWYYEQTAGTRLVEATQP